MNITIRSEKVKDYPQIAEVHALAFDYSLGMGEVLLVDALRHRKTYDQELSLVAEIDNLIVGHVLFSPLEIMVGGISHKAVNLAPIAIHPSFQKKGIGSLLIEEGHKKCIERGFEFSILLGDPNYYSRFGYQPDMYGSVATLIDRKEIKHHSFELTARRVKQEDIPLLMELWEQVYGKDDLAIKPSPSLLNWISTSSNMTATILEENEETIGYIRYQTNNPKQISYFLPRDHEAATKMIEYIHSKIDESEEKIVLPLHPASTASTKLIKHPFSKAVRAWDAGMIKIFNTDNPTITEYCNTVKQDPNKIGLVSWPVEFDNC